MGRLFWKFFIFFWLAQLTTSIGVGAMIWWKGHDRERMFASHERERILLNSAEATLRHGGPRALVDLVSQAGDARLPPVFAFDEQGRELLDRLPPNPKFAPGGAPETILAPDGRRYRLLVGHLPPPPGSSFMPPIARPGAPPPPPSGPRWLSSPLFLPIVAGVIVSFLFAALLARYVSKPIRHLKQAFETAADGDLKTRLGHSMGQRRDELADLGRDFDRMARQLESLMQSQRRLLHDVSHELRSPLARLQAIIGLMRQQPDPERLEQFMRRLEKESERIDLLVSELLTLARLEAGARAPSRHIIDLSEIVEAVAQDASIEAQGKPVRIRVQAEPTVLVEGDAPLLHRAIENIMRNAIKYAPVNGEVSLESGIERERVYLAICDDGPGVPADELDKIFAPFFRSRTAGANHGYGLGLTIARRIVEAHGGSLSAVNRPERGLQVRLELPHATSSAETDPAREA